MGIRIVYRECEVFFFFFMHFAQHSAVFRVLCVNFAGGKVRVINNCSYFWSSLHQRVLFRQSKYMMDKREEKKRVNMIR